LILLPAANALADISFHFTRPHWAKMLILLSYFQPASLSFSHIWAMPFPFLKRILANKWRPCVMHAGLSTAEGLKPGLLDPVDQVLTLWTS
jgi:hypothetical protein